LHAPQADHAEEVLDMLLPTGHQPAKVMEPSEKSLDSPTSPVATQRATILRRCSPHSTMRCDPIDAITLGQISIQPVTVICFVANQGSGEAVEEAVPEDAFDKLAFVRRSAFDTDCERKTVIIRQSDDFRSFAARGPLFAT
jgi:hypothetical protein